MRRLLTLLGLLVLAGLAGCSGPANPDADLPLTRTSLLFFYTEA